MDSFVVIDSTDGTVHAVFDAATAPTTNQYASPSIKVPAGSSIGNENIGIASVKAPAPDYDYTKAIAYDTAVGAGNPDMIAVYGNTGNPTANPTGYIDKSQAPYAASSGYSLTPASSGPNIEAFAQKDFPEIDEFLEEDADNGSEVIL